MATVKHFLAPEEAQYLAANFPQYVKNNGSNFPVPGMAFDASAATGEKAYFKLRANNYGSGNLTLELEWYADTATSGDVKWGARIACITPDTDSQDIETKAFATQTTVTDTHLGTTGQRLHRCSITISNLDSIAADDELFLEIQRLSADAADTMTGDAILVSALLTYSDT